MASNNSQMTDPAKSWIATFGGLVGAAYTYDLTENFFLALIGMIVGAYAGYVVENVIFRILIILGALIRTGIWRVFWDAILN